MTFGDIVEGFVAAELGSADDDYVMQILLPFLEVLVTELCKTQGANPFVDAAVIVVDRMCADDTDVRDVVHKWASRKGCASLEVDMPSVLVRETKRAENVVKREKERGDVSFFFVDADHIRKSSAVLPSWQELRKQRGVLVKRTLNRGDAYRRMYTECLAVSHRWEMSTHPDVDGTQMRTIRQYLLNEGCHVEYVWYDYWCMPQGERTPAENVWFKWMLANVNLLYLGAKVLLLVDVSYLSRFWTQFEAWLSLQTTSSVGLRTASDNELRAVIRCIHNATYGSEDRKLVSMWRGASCDEVRKVLSSPDVVVTNQSDKEVQLERTSVINDEVRGALNVESLVKLRDRDLCINLRKLGFTCEVAMQAGLSAAQAKEAGYDARQLNGVGYSAAELGAAGYSVGELKDGGYTAEQLEAADYCAEQLKEAGFTASQLQQRGHTVGQLKEIGYKAEDLRRLKHSARCLQECGYTARELKQGGYTARQVKEAGFPLEDLREAGWSVGQLKKNGYTAQQLKDAGFSARRLKQWGQTAGELAKLGYSARELKDDFTAAELKEAGLLAEK